MNKPPAFQFYARDWLSDESVMGMPLASRGAYITLLAVQWLEGSIPADVSKLSRMLGGEDLAEIWPRIADKFPPTPDAQRLANTKLESVRAAMLARREKQSRGVKKGAAGLWGKPKGKPKANPKGKLGLAVAVASAITSSLLTEFPDKAHRDAVDTALRGLHPQAVEHTIRGLHDGTTRTYPYPVIGRALVELQAAGTTFSAKALDAFCRRIQAGDPPPRAPSGGSGYVPPVSAKPITDQPPPREPTPEETLADLEAKLAAQAARKRAA